MAEDLRRRYDALWQELTTVEVFGAGEEWRVDDRVRRLNDLGFDVDEIELVDDPNHPDGHVLRLTTLVVEPGHHRRRLLQLTGLDVQENQARRLLNDILEYRGWLERRGGAPVNEQVAALRWMVEVFEPTLAAVPAEFGASSRTPRSSTRSSSTAGSCPRLPATTSAWRRDADYLEVLPSVRTSARC